MNKKWLLPVGLVTSLVLVASLGKIPGIFANTSSITWPSQPELTLSTEFVSNNIAGANDTLTLNVSLSNQDDIDNADNCASAGTYVTADFSKYVNNPFQYPNPSAVALSRTSCGDGSNQTWSVSVPISLFTVSSEGGLDVNAGDLASRVTVYAGDNDESPAANNTSNALGDGVIDTAATGGVDNIRPDITSISTNTSFITDSTEELIVTMNFNEPMDTMFQSPYLSFYTECECNVFNFNEETSQWLDSDTFESHYDITDSNLEQFELYVEISPNGTRDVAGNVLTFSNFYDHEVYMGIDQAEPMLVWSKFVGPNTLSVKFTEFDTELIQLSDFTNLYVDGEESPRNLLGLDFDNYPEVLISFDGDPVAEEATGIVDILNASSIHDTSGNEFVPLYEQVVTSQLGIAEVHVDDDYTGPEDTGEYTWLVNAFNNIPAAIDAVNEGGTVFIHSGEYITTESIYIEKPVSLVGPGLEEEEESALVVNDDCDYVFSVESSNVTIQGLEIRQDDDGDLYCKSYPTIRVIGGEEYTSNVTITGNDISGGYRGVQLRSDSMNSTITNNTFHDNDDAVTITGSVGNVVSGNEIFHNQNGILFRSGEGNYVIDGNIITENDIYENFVGIRFNSNMYVESDESVVIDMNTISSNSCDGIYISSDVEGVLITNNQVTDNGGECYFTGIYTESVSNITIHSNFISGNDSGLANDSEGTLDAIFNYWGSASGPNTEGGDSVYGDVQYEPFFIDEEMTTLNTYEDVPVTSLAPLTFNVPEDQTAPSANVNTLLTIDGDTKSGVIPQMSGDVQTPVGQVSFAVPTGTTVTGPSTWDGTIKLPQIKPNSSVTNAGGTVSSVIEIGFDDVELTFDKGIRLLIPGQGEKEVGYSRAGVFTKITTPCTDDSQTTGDALPAGGDCFIQVGDDMVVWTKHFTSFVSFGAGGGSRLIRGFKGSTVCGNGVVESPNSDGIEEACDDGNIEDGDGCSAVCALEESAEAADTEEEQGIISSFIETITGVLIPQRMDTEEVVADEVMQEMFTDIAGHEDKESIENLKKRGVMDGYADNAFKPERTMNRAETAKVVSMLMGLQPTAVESRGFWFAGYIRVLIKAGVIKSDVSPSTPEYRANFIALVAKAKGVKLADLPACTTQRYKDVKRSDWFCPVLEHAAQEGWTHDSGSNFNPAGLVKRGWAAGVLDRAF